MNNNYQNYNLYNEDGTLVDQEELLKIKKKKEDVFRQKIILLFAFFILLGCFSFQIFVNTTISEFQCDSDNICTYTRKTILGSKKEFKRFSLNDFSNFSVVVTKEAVYSHRRHGHHRHYRRHKVYRDKNNYVLNVRGLDPFVVPQKINDSLSDYYKEYLDSNRELKTKFFAADYNLLEYLKYLFFAFIVFGGIILELSPKLSEKFKERVIEYMAKK